VNFGFGEILILALIALLLFGAGKIPKLMGDMAGGIKAFKKGMADMKSEEPPPAPPPPSAPPPSAPPASASGPETPPKA
jgi:sec-independent protein translocase protein TatA